MLILSITASGIMFKKQNDSEIYIETQTRYGISLC